MINYTVRCRLQHPPHDVPHIIATTYASFVTAFPELGSGFIIRVRLLHVHDSVAHVSEGSHS